MEKRKVNHTGVAAYLCLTSSTLQREGMVTCSFGKVFKRIPSLGVYPWELGSELTSQGKPVFIHSTFWQVLVETVLEQNSYTNGQLNHNQDNIIFDYLAFAWKHLTKLLLFIYLFIWDRVSLHSCPGTPYVHQAGLKLRDLPTSAFTMLGLKVCYHHLVSLICQDLGKTAVLTYQEG